MSEALAAMLPLAASLAAVLVIAWLTGRMGLGPSGPAIRDEAHALALAEEAECGFVGVEAWVDADGRAAIVRDRAGDAMLVRAHGVAHAARRIGRDTDIRLEDDRLVVTPADRRFGPVTLTLGAGATTVADALRRVAS